MTNFFKQIFIWWNRQTIGTLIYTFFYGKFVGIDEFNNKYYTNKYGKRWVIYYNIVEASKIPPDWHSWIHFIENEIPNKNAKKFLRQKKYVENLTGTNMAHKPEGSLKFKSKKNMKKYEVWRD